MASLSPPMSRLSVFLSSLRLPYTHIAFTSLSCPDHIHHTSCHIASAMLHKTCMFSIPPYCFSPLCIITHPVFRTSHRSLPSLYSRIHILHALSIHRVRFYLTLDNSLNYWLLNNRH